MVKGIRRCSARHASCIPGFNPSQKSNKYKIQNSYTDCTVVSGGEHAFWGMPPWCSILETCVLTHLSTIISLMKYTCKDGLSCTVYVTNEHIVHQLILLIFFCIGHTPENFKRKQTPAVHTILLRVI